jgi:rod shape determining protein RodA
MASFLKRIDFLLLIPAILLSSLGLLLIFSTSYESDPSFFLRQAIYVTISVSGFLVISRFNFQSIIHISPYVYILSLLILVVTLILGQEVRGSTRWIDLAFITIQGSEVIKPILVLTLAYFFTRTQSSSIKKFVIGSILVLPPLLLILRQPDLSNGLILFSSWVFMVFISGTNLLYLTVLGSSLLFLTPFIWNQLLKEYQRERILTFFNPNIDPQGSSYNLVQALIALGSGQMLGRGLGHGTQSHLDFLPEGRTDFIFSVAGEELGFLGLSLIIIIFAFLVYRILKIAWECKLAENKLFAYGAAFLIGVQFFINAAMNMGIFPVSGVTLPLISFGGSSMVSTFILLGLVGSAKNG